MIVFERIEGEPRLRVASQTNPDQSYVIDLLWQPEPWSRPRLACGCIRGLDGKDCCHLRLIRELLKKNHMNPEVKAKWIEALRSGRHKQGIGALRTGDAFCCLGVLCDISGLSDWRGGEAAGYLGQTVELPDEVCRWAGLTFNIPIIKDVARMNDRGDTFEQIAKVIEENL